MKTLTFSPEQAAAISGIEAFLKSDLQTYVLHGLAGTGKTTVLADVARRYPDAILCTLTGKAASVLRRKTDLPACTIHAAFYQIEEVERRISGRKNIKFRVVHDRDQLAGKIVLLDECSMVDENIARDLIRTGAKIVACGDPGQLPPVSGRQFFDQPDCTLREIHRQALESPIIRQAHRVRSGQPYEADGEAFRVCRRVTNEEIIGADAILTFSNNTRIAANAHARRARGIWEPAPQPGEPVMCLKNVREIGIFNGAVYTLLEPFDEGDHVIKIDRDGEALTIPFVTFSGLREALPDGVEEAVTSFDFGYAMTVHKSQGSEWSNVILLDECKKDIRDKWLYTGITRAADRIIVRA